MFTLDKEKNFQFGNENNIFENELIECNKYKIFIQAFGFKYFIFIVAFNKYFGN